METGREQSAFIFASASVGAGVDIDVRMNSRDAQVATIGFGSGSARREGGECVFHSAGRRERRIHRTPGRP
jgi:hypothetical protein